MSASESGGAAFNPAVRTEDGASGHLWPEEFHNLMAELRPAIDPEIFARLRDAHQRLVGCSAHTHRQPCCFGWLVEADLNYNRKELG